MIMQFFLFKNVVIKFMFQCRYLVVLTSKLPKTRVVIRAHLSLSSWRSPCQRTTSSIPRPPPAIYPSHQPERRERKLLHFDKRKDRSESPQYLHYQELNLHTHTPQTFQVKRQLSPGNSSLNIPAVKVRMTKYPPAAIRAFSIMCTMR